MKEIAKILFVDGAIVPLVVVVLGLIIIFLSKKRKSVQPEKEKYNYGGSRTHPD